VYPVADTDSEDLDFEVNNITGNGTF
jgi:hypothetical protein